jgi:endonuclease/exonuclease/phosphatase family metal-dependent hydrolase
VTNQAVDEYRAHRVAQAWELARFVDAVGRGGLVVVAGDLNASPATLEYRVLRAVGKVRPLRLLLVGG